LTDLFRYLDTEDPDEPYLAGLKYHAMPPLKRFRDMEHLSGGEKTMAALALLFAVHSYQPSPFFVLDEVDAALDSVNVTRLISYIRRNAGPGMQFIVISLKPSFFEGSETLVGVMRDQSANSSKTLTLDVSADYYLFTKDILTEACSYVNTNLLNILMKRLCKIAFNCTDVHCNVDLNHQIMPKITERSLLMKLIILTPQLPIEPLFRLIPYFKIAAPAFTTSISSSTVPPLDPIAPIKVPPTFSGTPPPKNIKPLLVC
jgi:RecF/RecN/SMC N terminal domain